MADLRSLDFRTCNLEGSTLHAAYITGYYFPKEQSPKEIRMSVKYEIRMRYC